jgi:hypothetical protein
LRSPPPPPSQHGACRDPRMAVPRVRGLTSAPPRPHDRTSSVIRRLGAIAPQCRPSLCAGRFPQAVRSATGVVLHPPLAQ